MFLLRDHILLWSSTTGDKGIYNRLPQITHPNHKLPINDIFALQNLIFGLTDLKLPPFLSMPGGYAWLGISLQKLWWLVWILLLPKLCLKFCSFEQNQSPWKFICKHDVKDFTSLKAEKKAILESWKSTRFKGTY